MLDQSGLTQTAWRNQCDITSVLNLFNQEACLSLTVTKYLSDTYLPTTKGFIIAIVSII